MKDLLDSLKWTVIYLALFGVVMWAMSSTAVIDANNYPGELNSVSSEPNNH